MPNRKIVYDDAFEAPDAETMIVTVTFNERDGRTTLTVHTLFESAAMKEEYAAMGMVQGLNSSLDQLGDVVAAMSR